MSSGETGRAKIFLFMAFQINPGNKLNECDLTKYGYGTFDKFDLKYLHFVPFNTVFLYQVTSYPDRILKI